MAATVDFMGTEVVGVGVGVGVGFVDGTGRFMDW